MPPPLHTYESYRRHHRGADRPLAWWVRGLLVGMVLGLVAVFSVAIYLRPYDEGSGEALRLATHRQLGLPPCSFIDTTGVPCPACGMTTSFALLVRADVMASLRANWVGTMLATFCLLLIPWALATIWLGRPLFIRSLEKGFITVVVGLVVLMFLRWLIVLGMLYLSRGG